MKCLIASAIMEDQITTADRQKQGPETWTDCVLGGAGLYAYAGIRVFDDDVQIACNVERGHLNKYRDWYGRNGIRTDAINECLEPGSVTKITYFADGTREDVPTDSLAKKRLRNPAAAQVENLCSAGIAGLYLFRHLDEDDLKAIIGLSERYGFKTLWEIASDAAIPENWGRILRLMKRLTAFSINLREAGQLFPDRSEEQIVELFQNTGCPYVFLRCGARGAYMITAGEQVFCESVSNATAVDTTGAGNASTAAVLYGICKGEPLRTIGIRGSVAASYIIGQFGPPPRFDRAMQAQAEQAVKRLSDR